MHLFIYYSPSKHERFLFILLERNEKINFSYSSVSAVVDKCKNNCKKIVGKIRVVKKFEQKLYEENIRRLLPKQHVSEHPCSESIKELQEVEAVPAESEVYFRSTSFNVHLSEPLPSNDFLIFIYFIRIVEFLMVSDRILIIVR